MNVKNSARALLIVAVIAAVLASATSCASFQRDLLAKSAGEAADKDIDSLEKAIAPLEASPAPESIIQARSLVGDLERKGIRDAVFEARLAAWSGRLSLIEGKRADAEKLAKRSRSLLPGDVPGTVLSLRLERDGNLRLEGIEKALLIEPSSGQYLLERANTLLELRRYREGVAAFDAAFPLLPGFYEVAWKNERNRAWSLRDLDPSVSADQAALAEKDAITWRDACALAQEAAALPASVKTAKGRGPDALFNHLAAASYIPRAQVTKSDDTIDRADAAWFLWHVVAGKAGDPSLLTKYSARFRTGTGSASPVADVPLESPFFDSILGAVEREIMALPDGVNFLPALPVKGADFMGMLARCK